MIDQSLIENLWQLTGRRDTYAVQLADGSYARVEKPLRLADLVDHLRGTKTIGTYLLDQDRRCSFAVLDADQADGLGVLRIVQAELAGVPVHLERSRRGGHGWILFDQAYPADQVRAWLSPLAARHHLELYPKQSASAGVGSLIRLPLGIHRKSGTRYPFIDQAGRAVACNTEGILAWLPSAARVSVPVVAATVATKETRPAPSLPLARPGAQYASIREWNAAHNPLAVIARYVDLDSNGVGCCPFGEHHANGKDTHASLQVYEPHAPGGYCWYCHALGAGGSLFDFLAKYHGLAARDLWRQLQQNGGDRW
jgi:TOTE conflict system primase-like protein